MSSNIIEKLVTEADKKISAFRRDCPAYSPGNVSGLLFGKSNDQVAFVDLVMEGGGVKGIATVGVIYGLEKLGVRFRKVAGTSAGSIVAAIAAAMGSPMNLKAKNMLTIMTQLDFYSFVDGGSDAKALLEAMSEKKSNSFFGKFAYTTRKMVAIARNADDLLENLGINPGNEFRSWITQELRHINHREPFTVGVLDSLCNTGVVCNDDTQLETDLQMVLTDISCQRKAIMPRDLPLYVQDSARAQVKVGDLVRGSMSIPGFFEPFRLKDFDLPNKDETENLKLPGFVTFVDGGVVSNFPLGIFDVGVRGSGNKPKCPTFGILIDERLDRTTPMNPKELTYSKDTTKNIDNLLELGMGIFSTSQEYGDKAYIANDPHAAARVIHVSNQDRNGDRIQTTQFNLDDNDKEDLFMNGVNRAIEFLRHWNFEEYVNLYR